MKRHFQSKTMMAPKKKGAGSATVHRAPADEDAATELVLYIENTSDLSPDGPSGQGRSVLLNALRKWRNGTYDPALAVRLFEYLTESGAKRYAKEMGSSEKEWSTMFTPATRHEAAKQLEESFRNSVEHGEYDHVDTRIGVPDRGQPTLHEHQMNARRKETRIDRLRSMLPSGYSIETYSPGDGGTRYRFFQNAPQNQSYFGPDDGIYTALGYKDAETFAKGLMRASSRSHPHVRAPRVRETSRAVRTPARMDDFTRQYMETALWSSTDESTPSGGEPMDKNYGIDDIAPETRDKMIADCADFQQRYKYMLDNAYGEGGIDSERAGHNFWLSRNGHGAGFSDDNLDDLQKAAKSYGEYQLYVGDDGMIYGS